MAGTTYTLVATAKNEGPYLLEWVAFHRMIGFDNILIFQNDSDDGTHEVLRILDDLGVVKYRYNRAAPGRHQVKAYKRAARQPEFQSSDWVIALDLDEFLQIHVGQGHLDDLFAALPPVDEVLLNWRRFGHGDQFEITDELVPGRFTRAEPSERVAKHLTPYKALFRPALFERPGVHRPFGPKAKVRTCNGSGLVEPDFVRYRFRATDPGQRKLAQINHYIVRDAASFVLKSQRGSAHQANRDIGRKYWTRRNYNDAADFALADRQPKVVAAMAALNAQSGGRLEALRIASVKHHLARFKALMAEPAYRELYAFCSRSKRAA